ncbi:hypothetical protein [Candidatus Laterigemmans baculatus]|uniref:hypothetical protein n=1 Tax=Candidatus Laterigemmans baculatus TaxID=2770505 RepID=UPI0013DCEE56|nr:hypothetical protein [Candidatus Laterigemmans baculatus]
MPRLIFPSHHRLVIIAIAGLWIATFANSSDAQILIWPPEDAPAPKAEPKSEDEVKTLQITPAPEPEPALRYRFWPIPGEETPGNAMTLYQRAIAMRLEQRAERQTDPFFENYDQWMNGPLDELPKEAVRDYLEKNQAVLAELHRAASMKDSEHAIGLETMPGSDALQVLLTELQQARDLARLLVLEARLARSEKRYEDAVQTFKASFRLAETVGQATDLLVGRLIGLAIANHMLQEVQEMATQPDSPNMYWAFASLPDSLWEIRQALEFELNLTGRFLPQLANVTRDTSLSDAGWQSRIVEATTEYMEIAGPPAQPQQLTVQSRLVAGSLVLAFDGRSRDYLEQIGYSPEAVQAMSPSEAVLRGIRERLQRLQDEQAKWALLPYRIAKDYEAQTADAVRSRDGATDPASVMVSLLAPAVEAAHAASVQTEQTAAFSATIEALRMHAAEHGQFPESLENLKPVPAIPDPATGEHFGYEKISDTEAKLERVPVGGQPDPTLRLELRQ